MSVRPLPPGYFPKGFKCAWIGNTFNGKSTRDFVSFTDGQVIYDEDAQAWCKEYLPDALPNEGNEA